MLDPLLVANDPLLLSSLGLQRRRRLYANRDGQLQRLKPQPNQLRRDDSADSSDAESDDRHSSSD